MSDFLPQGYEELKITKNYISLSKLEPGEHKFRIVQRPKCGWVEWKERKPYRYRPEQKPDSSFDAKEPLRPFWACYVWDYARKGLFIVEITQATVLKALTAYGKDEVWGDFTKYDIKIVKEGSGKETKYIVSPVPHKEMVDEIVEALMRSPVKLEALYDGGDPWGDYMPNKDGVTQQEAIYLDKLIGDDQNLRDNILGFLKSNGYGDGFMNMPSDMYPKMVERATQNRKNRAEQELNEQKRKGKDISMDIDTMFDEEMPLEASM